MNRDGFLGAGTQAPVSPLLMMKWKRWAASGWASKMKNWKRPSSMKIRIAELRKLIRKVIAEGPSGPGITADPTDVKGFYPYEIERGTDIFGYWYKSPGDKGSNDPMRPEDAEEYIGFKTKGAKPEDAAAEAAPEETSETT